MIEIDYDQIAQDLQHKRLLEEVADEVVDLANANTTVNIQAARGNVEFGEEGPSVIVGARAAAAVSVEYGTRFRHASAPIRRAGMTLGLKVPK